MMEAPEGPIDTEILVLISKYLSQSSKFPRTLRIFQDELESQNSLGSRYMWDGGRFNASFDDYCLRYPATPSDQLDRLIRRTDNACPGLPNLVSLMAPVRQISAHTRLMEFDFGLSHCYDTYCLRSNRFGRVQHKITWMKSLWSVQAHMQFPVYCGVFDRSGQYFITGADDYLVKVWNVDAGLLAFTCRGHIGEISIIAVSWDNSLFASACTTGIIRLWRLSDGVCLKVLRHEASVTWLAFDKCSNFLVSVSDDGKCAVWNTYSLCYSDISMTCSSSFLDYIVSTEVDICCDWENERLTLPHYTDSVSYELCGSNVPEPVQIKCMCIHPAGIIVVTGGADGVGRVWQTGNSDMLIQHRNNHSVPLPSMVSADYDAGLRCVNERLLLRLEGHLQPITDISFTTGGDRLLTSSLQDGTVRIWSFNSDFSSCEQLVLKVVETSSLQHFDATAKTFSQNRRPMNRKKKSSVDLIGVGWCCNDQMIATLESLNAEGSSEQGQMAYLHCKLKIWDSFKGQLLRLFENETQDFAIDSQILSVHPVDSNILLTTGKDCLLTLWDANTLEQLNQIRIGTHHFQDSDTFPNAPSLGAHDAPSPILDASFSDDGLHIVLTDSTGKILVFGYSCRDRYLRVPTEQYFSTDYAEVYHDEMGFAFDLNTQLPVADCPRGLLCKGDGTPYDDQPKHCSQTEIMDKFNYSPIQFSFEDSKFQELLSNRTYWRNAIKTRTFGSWLQESYSRMLHAKYSQSTLSSSTANSSSLRSRSIPATFLYSAGNQHGMQQIRRARDPVITDGLEVADEDDENVSRWRVFDPEVSEKQRLDRESRRFLRDQRKRALRGDESDSSSDAASGSAYGHSHSKRLGRTRNGSSRRSAAIDSDSENSNSQLLFSSDSSNASISNRRRKKPRSNRSSDRHFQGNVNQQVVVTKERVRTPKPTKYLTTFDRNWLQMNQTFDCQYVPQMGDDVYYVLQGHREYLEQFPEKASPPWIYFPVMWPIIRCEVIGIEFSFPIIRRDASNTSIIAELTLRLTGIPLVSRPGNSICPFFMSFGELKSTRHSNLKASNQICFKVQMRNIDFPDYLIPAHLLHRAIATPFRVGMRIVAKYAANADPLPLHEADCTGEDAEDAPVPTISIQEYQGTIVALHVSDPSCWNAIEVVWDSSAESTTVATPSDQDRISPWEVMLIDGQQDSMTFGPQSIADSVIDSIISQIGNLMTREEFQCFEYPVDSSVFPDYYQFIPVYMCTDLIRERLKHRYYRQIDSLLFDIDLISSNCNIYNEPGSAISQLSLQLVNLLREAVLPRSESIQEVKVSNDYEDLSISSAQDAENSQVKHTREIRSSNRRLEIDSKADEDAVRIVVREESGCANRVVDSNLNKSSSFNSEDSRRIGHSRRLDPELRSSLLSLVTSLEALDCDKLFSSPVTEDIAPGYFDVIDTPMDIERIRNKISKRQYTCLDDAMRDVLLLFTNCEGYNEPESEIVSYSRRIEAAIRSQFADSYCRCAIGRPTVLLPGTKGRSRKPEDEHNTTLKIKLRLDPVVRENIMNLIMLVEKLDEEADFAFPVDEEIAPNYYDVIDKPMDLNTIREKLSRRNYIAVEDAVEDIMLMLNNCEKYNSNNSALYKKAKRIKKAVVEFELAK